MDGFPCYCPVYMPQLQPKRTGWTLSLHDPIILKEPAIGKLGPKDRGQMTVAQVLCPWSQHIPSTQATTFCQGPCGTWVGTVRVQGDWLEKGA